MPEPISPVRVPVVAPGSAPTSGGSSVPRFADPDLWFATLTDHYASNALKWGMWANIPMSAAYSLAAKNTERTWRVWQALGWCDGQI